MSEPALIVVADVNQCRRRDRGMILERSGFRVLEAGTASAALRLVAESRPVLVLLAENLPDMETPETCRRIKEDAAAPLVLHIASRESAAGDGADIHLREPLNAGELAATVLTCARLRQREAEQRQRITELEAELGKCRCAEGLRERDERLSAAFEAAELGIWWVDIADGLNTRDASLNRLLGLPAAATTIPVDDSLAFVHPEDRPKICHEWQQLLAGRGSFDLEFRVIRADGVIRWVEDRGRLIYDDAGKPIRATGAMSDITERKREEERIRFQANLLNAVEQAIVVTGPDWKIMYWNRFAERLYGWRADEAMGRDVIELFAPELTAPQRRELLAALLAGEPVNGEFMVRHREGHVLPVLATNSPVYDDQGRLAYVICVSIDITPRRKAEEVLQELNASLALADRRKDEFLAMLAHELRNPLAPIRNAVRILQELGTPDMRLAWARDVIDRQVRHLARLVDDLLDVSRLVRGRIELKKETVDLAEVVEHALEVSRPLIQGHRHELVVCLPGGALRTSADPTRLIQVLENLLTNAAKYTPEGGVIRLEAGRDGDCAVIRVWDTGTGIPADLLPRVFDLFTQGERSLDRSQGGLGIGLTIVKELVELHGGEVEVRSHGHPGQGSEFTVKLPLILESSGAACPVEPPEELRASGRRRRILVVDDNEDAVDTLAILLELEGHEIRTALDGPAALEIAREFRPDAVLLDIGLPGMDGYEVARRLRGWPETRGAALVAITGYGQLEDKCRAESAGFDHHMVKPVDPNELNRLLAGSFK
jgi:PAS domain S-box-containing protein